MKRVLAVVLFLGCGEAETTDTPDTRDAGPGASAVAVVDAGSEPTCKRRGEACSAHAECCEFQGGRNWCDPVRMLCGAMPR